MRFERLVIEAEDNTFSLEFHPRLTVISGVGPIEREGLTTELIGALSSSRAGVHAEFLADAGNRFAIFRPHGARNRVIDIASAIDVTDRFADETGKIDLLALFGLDSRTAKHQMKMTSTDLATSSNEEQIVRRLAAVNPAELWDAVGEVTKAQRVVDEAAEAAGSAPEDAAVVSRIEKRHQEFESIQSLAERSRRASFFAGAVAAMMAIPSAFMFNRIVAMLFVIGAAAVTAISFIQYQRMPKARLAEDEALAEAGAQTYLGFHLQRVNGLLDNGEVRSRLIEASVALETAEAAWTEIAGNVSTEWVVEHKRDLQHATERRKVIEATSTVLISDSTHPESDDKGAEMADALVVRLAALRNIEPIGESLPLLLDDALDGLDTESKAPLLELLLRASESQQIVFMTNDPDVAEWGRLEAITGAVSVLEPTPDDEAVSVEEGGLKAG